MNGAALPAPGAEDTAAVIHFLVSFRAGSKQSLHHHLPGPAQSTVSDLPNESSNIFASAKTSASDGIGTSPMLPRM